MSKETIEKALEKYEDFWARHNLTSRISIFIFVSIYLFSVIFILLNPINAPLAQVILNTTSYIALLSILVDVSIPGCLMISKVFELGCIFCFNELGNNGTLDITFLAALSIFCDR